MDIYDRDAEIYDIAFSWDVSSEVDWLIDRMGGAVTSVLEPACGSGRMFGAFARRGVTVAGVDLSAAMLARAADRMAAADLPAPLTALADIADFDLGRTFDGAICPISTFGYLLERDDALAHLRCVARHLVPGARYLVQIALAGYDTYVPETVDSASDWEARRGDTRLRATVTDGALDRASGTIAVNHRFEVLEGPDAGAVFEEEHRMRLWDWASWSSLIADSPFTQTAAYDGNTVPTRPPLPLDASLEGKLLVWHELTLE